MLREGDNREHDSTSSGETAPVPATDPHLLLAHAVDEYRAAAKRGEPIDLEMLIAKYPSIVDEIRGVLPALACLSPSNELPTAGHAYQLSAGQQLGQFRIEEEIGRGGMGIVFRASDTSLGDRSVAVKVLLHTSLMDERQLVRFQNESRAAASLSHPNIVPVLTVGAHEGVHYYVMQLIDGETLAQQIANPAPSAASPCSASNVARLGVQAADALAHAHQHGVLHRDVKPANILVEPDGHLWLTDFGLARLDEERGLTATGDLLGTIRYMSPEQAIGRGGVVDQRADIYSLGVTLYERVTGQPAFAGDDRLQLLQQIATHEPKRPRQIDARIPIDLETILLKAIAKDAPDRYATAHDLRDDLQRFLDQKPIAARPPSIATRIGKWTRRHQTFVWTSVVAMALVLASLLVSVLAVSRAYRSTELQRVRAVRNLRLARDVIHEAWTKEAAKLADQPGMTIEQRKYLLKLVEFYENVPADELVDLQLHLEACRAHLSLGDIYRTLGDPKQAIKSYDRAIAECREKTDDKTDIRHIGYQKVLVQAHTGAGLAFQDLQQFQLAAAHHRQAEHLANALMAGAPDDVSIQGLVANRLHLAIALRDPTEQAEQEATLRATIGDATHLGARFPDSDEFETCVATGRALLGDMLRATGRLDEARQQFREAIAVQTRLAKNYPKNPTLHDRLAHTKHRFALMLSDNGRGTEAEETLREAIDIIQPLKESYPGRLHYLTEMAEIYADIGQLMNALERWPDAQQAFERTIQLLSSAADQHPRHRALHARVLGELGTLAFRNQQNEEAKHCFDESLSRWKELRREFPDHREFEKGWLAARADGSRLLDAAKRLAVLESTTDELRKLVEQSPDQVELKTLLIRHLSGMGDTLRREKQISRAETCFAEVTEIASTLEKDSPEFSRQQESAVELTIYGDISMQLGKFDQAETAHRFAVANYRVLLDESPNHLGHRLMLASNLKRLAWSRAALDRTEEAETNYLESIEIIRRILHDDPENPIYLAKLSRRLRLLGDLYLQSLYAANDLPSQASDAQRTESRVASQRLVQAIDAIGECIELVRRINHESPNFAWPNLSRGAGYYIEVQDRLRLAACQLQLGRANDQDDATTALATLTEAFNECKRAGNRLVGSIVQIELAELLMDQDRFDEALALVEDVESAAARIRQTADDHPQTAFNVVLLQLRCVRCWARASNNQRADQLLAAILEKADDPPGQQIAIAMHLTNWPSSDRNANADETLIQQRVEQGVELLKSIDNSILQEGPTTEESAVVASITDNDRCLDILGVANYRLGQLNEAFDVLTRAAEMNSGGTLSNRYHRAMILAKLGQLPAAREVIQAADSRLLRDNPLALITNWRLSQLAHEQLKRGSL